MANLSYIRNFCFSRCSKDELSYCLSTTEAAVEFISGGKLRDTVGVALSRRLVEKMLIQQTDSPLRLLFEHVANGNEAEVERLLSDRRGDAPPACHPLCRCDLCDLSGSVRSPGDGCPVTPFCRDERGYTALHVAAVYGQSQLIDLLVRKGSAVNAAELHGLTALHLACQRGFQGVSLLLLHYKATSDLQDSNGNTALHLACMYGHQDCVKALVYYDLQRCRLDLQNEKGDTCLHLAARWGYEEIIQVLLENGASVLVQNKSRETPLQCALNSKILTVMQNAQQETRIQPSPPSSSSSTESKPEPVRHREVEKLLRAVADGDTEMVRYLLELQHDEEAAAPREEELCHPLCQCARCAPAQKLPAQPAGSLSVNSSSGDGFTPLHVAALHGRLALAALLIRHGANVNARTNHGATPLHLAAQNSHAQVLRHLLECNAKVNKKDHYGNTPLIHACLRGNLETTALLLQGDAAVNAANLQGNTALHEAVRAGNQALVDLLLRGGASHAVRNKKQKTPLDSALELGGKNTEILRALQKASGLSPEPEPLKLLSVPKGALAHSFVRRLKEKKNENRIQRSRKGSGSPPASIQERRRGVTTEMSPAARRRPLTRCHTLDLPSATPTLGCGASEELPPKVGGASVAPPPGFENKQRNPELSDGSEERPLEDVGRTSAGALMIEVKAKRRGGSKHAERIEEEKIKRTCK